MKPSIRHYSDYRRFLREAYESRKSTPRALSLRDLAERIGANSSAYMKFIMDGSRNLSDKMIYPVAQAFNLSAEDQQYFEALVKFNQAKTVEKKNIWFEKLIALQNQKQPKHIAQTHFELFSEWYHPVIRELVTLYPFDGNWARLGRKVIPAITASQARKSVELLCQLGFITQTESGYQQTDPAIATGPTIHAHRVTQFQKKMTEIAADSFDRLGPEHRFSSSTTFGLSSESYTRFCKKLRQLRQELIEEALDIEHPDRVAQLAINLFLCSKPIKRPEDHHE